MNSLPANNNTKKPAHTPRPGRRTLNLEFSKLISEKRGGGHIEILPPLTEQEHGQIHYTQRYIKPRFSNSSPMNVFETYFAIKYKFMRVTELPPIRVFKADGQLWSVDNRRLWVMKNATKFHCEGPFTREQDSVYFNELVIKRRSLRGGSGNHVQFSDDPEHRCCIMAFQQGILDTHFAEVHLKISLEFIRALGKYQYSDNLIIDENSSLQSRIHKRYDLLKRTLEIHHINPPEKLHQMVLAFNNRN